MTIKNTTKESFAPRFPLPANGGVRFEKPRNKGWILSPAQRRAGWRRAVRRGLTLTLFLAAVPVGMELAGVMPERVTGLACAKLEKTWVPGKAALCGDVYQIALND